MAATDMSKAGLEIGCKVDLHYGRHGTVRGFIDEANVEVESLGTVAPYHVAEIARQYGDAQQARQRRFSRLLAAYPGDAGVPEQTDTIERYVLVQANSRDREEYIHIRATDMDAPPVDYAFKWGDTFEEATVDAGSEVLDGWLPEAVFDLDTGARIEVHVSSPIITRSEDQGVCVNALSEADLDALRAERDQLESQFSVSTREARRLEYIEQILGAQEAL